MKPFNLDSVAKRELREPGSLADLYTAYLKSESNESKREIWLSLIKTFMQSFCSFKPENYIISADAVFFPEKLAELAGFSIQPHVMPSPYVTNPQVFFFIPPGSGLTAQDVWNRYIVGGWVIDPSNSRKAGDPSICAQVVVTDFSTIAGWKRNSLSENFEPWTIKVGSKKEPIEISINRDWQKDRSASEVEQIDRLLRGLQFKEVKGFEQALLKLVEGKGVEALKDLENPAASFEKISKRGEGPLDQPIYGIEQIESNERRRRSAALLQTERFEFLGKGSGRLVKDARYADDLDPSRGNLLIDGDNLEVMQRLLELNLGRPFIDFIYIDPPFCSDRDYNYSAGGKRDLAFTDIWEDGLKSYLPWMCERLRAMQSLLKDSGVLCVHVDYRTAHYLKVELDKIFSESFVAEYIWRMFTPHNSKGKQSPAKNHQNLLLFSKSPNYFYRPFYTGYRQEYLDRARKDPDGRLWVDQNLGKLTQEKITELKRENRVFTTKTGKLRRKQFLDEMPGEVMGTVITGIDRINSQAEERTGYDTQKPEELLTRLIHSFSPDDGVVADFFLGSGTTGVVAQRLGRSWIGVDRNPQAIEVAADRIRKLAGAADGSSSRNKQLGYIKLQANQYFQEDVQSLSDRTAQTKQLSEFKRFILDNYLNAKLGDRLGSAKVHGYKRSQRGFRAVFVGPNSGPVTRNKLKEFLRAASKDSLATVGIDILGWEFEAGLLRNIQKISEQEGKEINLRKIEVTGQPIEEALKTNNVYFVPPARAKLNWQQKGKSLDAELKLQVKESNVREIHWFLMGEEAPVSDEKLSYIFDFEETDQDEEELGLAEIYKSTEEIKQAKKKTESKPKPSKKTQRLELSKKFQSLKPGEYSLYVRITDRFGRSTGLIEQITIKEKKESN